MTEHRRFTEETQLRVTESFAVDEVFLASLEDEDVMTIEYGDDGDIERCEIDPRILRSAMFLYSSMERTKHDWR